MKKIAVLVVLFALAFLPGLATSQPAGQEGSGMPGWPAPDRPVPHHDTGKPSKADSYVTQTTRLSEEGLEEVVELTGVDALVAAGADPLAGNYTLVDLDKVLLSSNVSGQQSIQTFDGKLDVIAGSQQALGNSSIDIAAGDVNNDGQAEQIAAWLDDTNHIWLSTGEMPGSLGRTTSAPAAIAHTDGTVDLLVRGYDEALWHCVYDSGTGTCPDWNNDGGGILLSAPAVASLVDGQFDAFVIGTDNEVYRQTWAGAWSTWQKVAGDWPYDAPTWSGPTPELGPLAVVARNDGFDLFRLAPDNTLRWHDGSAWHSLGGMLASEPGAISTGPGHMQVFARGVDDALWHRTYNSGSWGAWQRLQRGGMDEGVTIASAPTVVSPASG
ncbi:MAG: hypothetical protein RRC07_09370, partial [Anaerolineae bacterium]|nr:hypothetical protein [Anaerolineae bacterium]